MQVAKKENTPVIYNEGATKALTFSFPCGRDCFVMHWHERLEILRIKRGEMACTLGSETGTVKAGEAVIIPPRMAHAGRALTDIEYDVLMFDLRYFYNETDVCKKTLTAIFEGNTEFVYVTKDSDVISCIDGICHSKESDSLEAVSHVYLLLHLFLKRGIITLRKGESTGAVREIVEYIEENFEKDMSTKSLSEKFGYTPAHFCRKFKKATGLTPVTYLKIYRLEKAYKMIKSGEGQIFEIAAKCGFSDTNYFTRCFKAHYKKPPTYYKNKT